MYSLGKAPGVTTRYMDRLRVKGKAHPQSIYEVFETDPEPLRSAKIATRGTFEKGVGLYHMKEVDHALSLFRECLSRAPDDPAALAYVARCERTLAGGAWETTGELVAGTTPWTTEFVLGVEKMDEQHHTLLDHINELAPHVEDGDTASVSRILGFLAQYAKEHFGTEYGYMLRYRYPFTFEHVREHRSFIEYFLLMKAQIESGEHEPSFNVFQIQIFLVDWFTNHSTGTDRHLAQYLRRVWEGRDRPPTPGETETEVLVSHADDILGPEPEPAPGRPAVDTAGSLPTPPPGDREPTSPQSARLANPAAHRLTIGRRGSNVSDLAELTEERLRRQALDSPVHVGRRGSGTAELADVTEERLRRAGEGIGTGVLEPGEEVLD
ncbi:hemerythrin-like protein [Hyaloraphidium curvatum]|nr:hemerythrin-like protein [Hyaloraphidium curvatum]